MADDVERRLAAAAEALREHELAARRAAFLGQQLAEATAQVAALRAAQLGEHEDVARLEGMSLTRVLAALRGALDDELARERAEAEAARYRTASAQARLDAIWHECEAAQVRLRQLAEAPGNYAVALDGKERWLAESDDPRAAQLVEVAEQRGRLVGELREIDEALGAARFARDALARVDELLGNASGWSTYDTFFGGGAISSAIKQSRLDEAAEAAAHADRCLAALRTELADVGGVALTAPQLALDGTTRFLDVWFDNIFTDMAVRDRIKQAQHNVARSTQLVDGVYARLEQREAETRTRVGQLDAHRQTILTAR